MSLDCERRPKYPERTHAEVGKKLHKVMLEVAIGFKPGTLQGCLLFSVYFFFSFSKMVSSMHREPFRRTRELSVLVVCYPDGSYERGGKKVRNTKLQHAYCVVFNFFFFFGHPLL